MKKKIMGIILIGIMLGTVGCGKENKEIKNSLDTTVDSTEKDSIDNYKQDSEELVKAKYEYQIENEQVTLTKFLVDSDESEPTVVLPKEIDGYPVVTIGDYLFQDQYNIVTIIMPTTITSIGEGAFMNANDLTSVVGMDNVTSIGDGAFKDCDSFTTVLLPSGLTELSDGLFFSSGLQTIEVPEGVTTLVGGTFKGCTELTSVILHEGITSIGPLVFDGCTSLETLVIPDSVTTMSEEAIADCSKLTSITFSKNLKLEYHTVYNCDALTNIVIPEGITEMDSETLDDCDGITSITLPNSLTSIYTYNKKHLQFYVDSEKVVVVKAPAGSYAESYAKEEGLIFEAQ